MTTPAGTTPGSRKSDGPGSLTSFVGQPVEGAWVVNEVDDAPVLAGQVDAVSFQVTKETLGQHFRGILCGDETITFFYPVPVLATNFTAALTNNGVLDLAVRRGRFPTPTASDKSAVVAPPGGTLAVTKFDSPPLNSGLYFVQLHNPSLMCVTYDLLPVRGAQSEPGAAVQFLSIGNEPLRDDAVTCSTNFVGVDSTVARAEVGVRIDHPRASDLVLTLVSPAGHPRAAGGEPRRAQHERLRHGGQHHQLISGGLLRQRRRGNECHQHRGQPGHLVISLQFLPSCRTPCTSTTTA